MTLRVRSAVRKTAFFFGLLILSFLVSGTSSVQALEERELKAMEAEILAQQKKLTGGKISTSDDEDVRKEVETLQKELLLTPKRRRIRLGGDFDMTYDTNADREALGADREEGDSFFHLNPIVQFDLSGKRTDLRTELHAGHTYSVKRPEIDTSNIEGTVRFGRKFNRLTFSLNDRLNRDAIRVQGMDDKRIRWDTSHRSSLNYELGKKFSFNLENDYSRQDFPHENFDQDSTYTFRLDPNFFYQVTPKTRLSAGYRWGFSRIRQKTTDNATHEFRVGYFGKLTPKSSISGDIGVNIQTPEAAEATRSRQLQWNVGYIWQATPKTSLRVLYSNSIQRSIVDALGTAGTNELIKTTTHTLSDTLSVSFRFRMNRKISTQFSFDGSHSKIRTSTDDDPLARTRTFTFPFQVAIDYDLAKWIRLRFTYTFRYQLGNEALDDHRAHTWFVGSNLSF